MLFSCGTQWNLDAESLASRLRLRSAPEAMASAPVGPMSSDSYDNYNDPNLNTLSSALPGSYPDFPTTQQVLLPKKCSYPIGALTQQEASGGYHGHVGLGPGHGIVRSGRRVHNEPTNDRLPSAT